MLQYAKGTEFLLSNLNMIAFSASSTLLSNHIACHSMKVYGGPGHIEHETRIQHLIGLSHVRAPSIRNLVVLHAVRAAKCHHFEATICMCMPQ